MLVVFIGPPGSGKGTQASLLCQHLSITHLSTGDMFRAAIQDETELGVQAQEYMNRGELVPDQLVVSMVADALGNPPCNSGCLLDGFPRSLPQAEAWLSLPIPDLPFAVAVRGKTCLGFGSGAC